MNLRSDFKVHAIHEGNWMLILPDAVTIDQHFIERATVLVRDLTIENLLFCGAGLSPVHHSLSTKNLVSFCFDQLNAPTQVNGAFRVLHVLESPIVISDPLFKAMKLNSAANFHQIQEAINEGVSRLSIRAEANANLTHGMTKRQIVPRKNALPHPKTKDKFSTLRKLSIITRTTEARPEMLLRCISSVAKFSKSLESLEVEHIIVSSGAATGLQNLGVAIVIPNQTQILKSRLAGLIRGVQASTGDYVLFLDDDDFLNQELQHEIEFILTFDSNERIHFLDAQQVFERKGISQGKLKKGHRYKATKSLGSYLGPNRTHHSSVIYPRQCLVEIREISHFETYPNFLEDHLILILAMRFSDSMPAYFPKVLSWISIHGDNQSVLDQNLIEWSDSMSKLRGSLIKPSKLAKDESLLEIASIVRNSLHQNRTPFTKVVSVFSAPFWRTVVNFNIPKRVLSGQIEVRELWQKYLNH